MGRCGLGRNPPVLISAPVRPIEAITSRASRSGTVVQDRGVDAEFHVLIPFEERYGSQTTLTAEPPAVADSVTAATRPHTVHTRVEAGSGPRPSMPAIWSRKKKKNARAL